MTKWGSGLAVSAPELASTLDRDGFACIENVVSDEWLERARGHIRNLLAQNGNKFFSIVRPGNDPESPLAEIANDPSVKALMMNLTGQVCPKAVNENEEVYNVLRVIAGPKGTSGSFEFHYDPSVVTLLVPIFMPHNDPGKSGEFVMFPNGRPFRRSLVYNLIEKAIAQNRFAAKRTVKKLRLDEHVRLLYPGNIYLFWGYRTYHGNMPCAPHTLRATMLLHYGSPHGKSKILSAIRGGRRVVETVRRKLK